jgi:hypothetical protein
VKRRVYTWLTAILVVTLIFVILGKGAAAIIDERVGNRLRAVSARYGLVVGYDRVSFVSLTGITIAGLRLSFPEGRPILGARAVTVRVNPVSFLVGRPAITGCEAAGVTLNVRQLSDGTWELQKLRRPAASAGPSGASLLVWPLVASIDGLVVVLDRAGDSAVQKIDAARIEADPPNRAMIVECSEGGGDLRASIRKETEAQVSFVANDFPIDLVRPFIGSFIDFSTARLSASGEAAILSPEDAALRAEGTLDGIAVQHALLSRTSADGISFGFGLDLFLRNETVLLRSAHLSLGGETMSLAGTIGRPTRRPIVNLAARFDRLELGRVAAAIPLSLRPHLPDLAVQGTLDGEFTLYFDALRPGSLDYHFDGGVESFAVVALGPEVDVAGCSGTFSHTVVTREGETRAILVGPANPDYVPLANIPRHLVGAVLTAEDGSFFMHKGFSPRHIHEAMIANLEAGRVVRGASTLSMQLAKNLFLSRERTVGRKVEEAFITLALEQELDKKRMLEIYLNIIEWGPGVYGIGPAARHYFGKGASALGPVESAFLASIIARPSKGWGVRPLDHIGEGWWFYLRIILCKMYRRGDVDIETLRSAGVSDTEIRKLVEGDTAAVDQPLVIPNGVDGNGYPGGNAFPSPSPFGNGLGSHGEKDPGNPL